MKKIIILFLISISGIAINSCTNGGATSGEAKENVTFYYVPLVCGAYAEIGCGSRAKPALMEMEKNPAIKEAWLNRAGTVMAIVWNGAEQSNKIGKPIMDKYEIDFTMLKGDEVTENEKTFRQPDHWYRGADVDKLSMEEAKHIAGKFSAFALDRQLITQQEADVLIPKVEDYFKTELVKVRTHEQLNDDSRNKFSNDLIAMAESVLGKERTKNILEQYSAYQMEECRKNACTDQSKDACCKKKTVSSINESYDFDVNFKGCQTSSCAVGKHNAADVVAMVKAKTGNITQCPVSGAFFKVKENSPVLTHDGKTFHTCCASCAGRFKQDPDHFTKNVSLNLILMEQTAMK